MADLPPNLEHIGGNAVISTKEPIPLLSALINAKKGGVLKGAIVVKE